LSRYQGAVFPIFGGFWGSQLAGVRSSLVEHVKQPSSTQKRWWGLWRVDAAVLHRHNATPKTLWFQCQPQLPISSTFSIFQPQKVDPHKGMAGAGRPPSLLVVALSLPLPFSKHAHGAKALRIRTTFSAAALTEGKD